MFKWFTRLLLLMFLLLPLNGCITLSYFKHKYMSEAAAGIEVYGSKERLKKFDVYVLMNEELIDTSKTDYYSYFLNIGDSTDVNDESAMIASVDGVCNSFNTGITFFDCGRNESWEFVTFTFVLLNRETSDRFVLDKKTFRIGDHYSTNFHIKAFFVADRDKCPGLNRRDWLFKWDKAKPLYIPELQDTLYVYTEVKYSDEPHKGPNLW